MLLESVVCHLVVFLGMDATAGLKERLVAAFNASGYAVSDDDVRLTRLVELFALLLKTGRYDRLVSDVFATNDAGNLRSLVLEAIFAFQFESVGVPLLYEVSQRPDDETSVDFVIRPEDGTEILVEMRLVQQRLALTTLFEQQLRESGYFGTVLGGQEDRQETLRLQRLVLEKAINQQGGLIKFPEPRAKSYNLVAIEVSELHLGMIDALDCLLTAYGDPAVPDFARRNMFGLFQELRPEYPPYIQEVASRFAPFRAAVHGILFLRKVPGRAPADFRLEYIFVHNRQLVDGDEVANIGGVFSKAMKVWESVRNRKK